MVLGGVGKGATANSTRLTQDTVPWLCARKRWEGCYSKQHNTDAGYGTVVQKAVRLNGKQRVWMASRSPIEQGAATTEGGGQGSRKGCGQLGCKGASLCLCS
eukprot:364569-Chlamydomonas_euryale.AAC.12